ncbi:MAG: hypothetical protein CMI28_03640 [Opitutae bacterium]|nr:hypothetical protein [Opitutae bacterium]HAD20883.1 hypothetical protein [Opitutae bacterium]
MSIKSAEISSPKRENMLLNLGFNLLLPIVILRKGDEWLGKLLANITDSAPESAVVGSIILLLAISFPVSYGILDLIRRRKWNFFSILGAISALLTGGIGLLPGANVLMFAIKESALPAILGVITIITLKTKKPLVRLFLYNPEIIKVALVDQKLMELGTKKHFDRLLVKCTWLIGLSFAVSAVLNFILSRMIVVTEPSIDKIAFNDEVGQMMGWSLPVISIPCMIVSGYAFWLLIKGIKQFTGLSMEEVMAQAPPTAKR